MVNLKFYVVSFDRCDHKTVAQLSKEEREKVVCYTVNSVVPKLITARIKVINEWQLPWYSSRYQMLKYYDYGAIPHIVKNPQLIDGLTHIGLLQYDIVFAPNSVNELTAKLEEDPNQIFYVTYRTDALYFTKEQLNYIADYMSPKLNVTVDADKIWNEGWICETLSLTPVDVFRKFGEFMLKYQYDIENILSSNRWGVMNTADHRLCGFTERLWGMYLVSCGMPIHEMPIEHDRVSYEKHAG